MVTKNPELKLIECFHSADNFLHFQNKTMKDLPLSYTQLLKCGQSRIK